MLLQFTSNVLKRVVLIHKSPDILIKKIRPFHRTCAIFQDEKVTEKFIKTLKSTFGTENVSTSLSVRKQHGTDEGYHGTLPADVVVFAHSTEQVSEVARLCHASSIPMVPHGAGTGLEHGVGAVHGGVCVDFSKMTDVLEVNAEDFDATVEPGVTWRALNEYLRDTGLMFPVDPGADATLGGMASTGASGTNAVRYGTMKENVLNLEVVLADGTVMHTAGPGRRARKSSAGYNLNELFVGSEGTLGFITKATLRLHGTPETMVSAVCSFPSVKDAVDTVVQTLQCSIPVARIEFLDDTSMAISHDYSHLDFPITPTLFIEFHGSKESVQHQSKEVEEIASSNNGSNFLWAEDPEKRNKLWKARHLLYYATLAQKPGHRSITTDVCVPISKLTEMVVKTKEDVEASGLLGAIVGHVGDGNFHAFLMFDPENNEEFKTAINLAKTMAQRALSLNGTCTGEHGIGTGKIELLVEEYGEPGIQVMRNIKKALDPKNLMNPGKIFTMT